MLDGSASLRVVEWFTLRASGSIALSGDTVMDHYVCLSGGSTWSNWSHHPDTELKHAHMLNFGAELHFLHLRGFELFAIGG